MRDGKCKRIRGWWLSMVMVIMFLPAGCSLINPHVSWDEPEYLGGKQAAGNKVSTPAHDVALIRSQPQPATAPGDSGSPIVTRDGQTLLGMHVSGIDGVDDSGAYTVAAYMIPAWELLDPVNYTGVGREQWTLMKP